MFPIRGGAIGTGPDQFYVERDADKRVFGFLSQGRHCYLFAPKQSGKSSLAFHLQQRFREQGTCCIYLDLSTAFNIEDEQDEKQKASDICRQFLEELESEFSEVEECREGETDVLWPEEAVADPANLLIRLITKQLAPPGARRYVLFLDESDTIDALPPKPREGLVSTLVELMATPGERYPVTLCLLGSLPPASLRDWNDRLPKLLECKQINDFTREQIQVFLPAIEPVFTKCAPDDVLDACFEQTEGHPYLTQLLLHQAITIGDKDRKRLSRDLKKFVDANLISKPHFTLDSTEQRIQLPEFRDGLFLYKDLLEADIPGNEQDPQQIALYLSGLAAFRGFGEDQQLCPRNPIFSDYFDEDWLENIHKKTSAPPPVPNAHQAEPAIIALVDHTFCQGLDGKPAPYERKDNGRVLLEGNFYEFRLANPRTKRPFTLQLFREIRKTGGELWRNVARALVRVSGYRHASLPVIEDGGYRTSGNGADEKQEEFAYIIIQEGHVTLAESSDVIAAFREDKRHRALVQFSRLADALLKLHENRLIHRNLHPGAIDVVEIPEPKEGKADWNLKLTHFEMSDLVENRIRELDSRRKSLDAELGDEQLSFEKIQQLCAARSKEDLACLSPERLALLFRSRGVETLESLYSDVFSLGMVVYSWFIDDLPQEQLRKVFPGDNKKEYDRSAHKELVRSMSAAIKDVPAGEMPKKLKTLLTEMLDFDSPRNRPTIFQVVSEIARSLDDWSTEAEADRFIVAQGKRAFGQERAFGRPLPLLAAGEQTGAGTSRHSSQCCPYRRCLSGPGGRYRHRLHGALQ
uniref:Protein kinase domain-containing protein n=1 Tax=Candidatus Kentrum sp. MB TaxID=2138164 RepID=A0A450XJK7_9GAMM|nr:MAG: hypothetical protein BECKMB1821G_GA0114241_10506 [Candidatus Kentron sp. MB]VFK33629.1 MAG: hypothetical protein BECKMB1821I_GA0114274_10505 [Candidatus Kentron sp. MB]VFK76336.1 MAG: hypothetical protein BECKMB1821H_GA0114242_10525 [Candidatus Kentron sp. MB]